MAAVIPGWVALLVVAWAVVACTATVPTDSLRSPQEESMQEVVYTLGVWKVKPGQEADFIAAWKALGEIFSRLPHPPGTGTLIQNVSDPAVFYSARACVASLRCSPRESRDGRDELAWHLAGSLADYLDQMNELGMMAVAPVGVMLHAS